MIPITIGHPLIKVGYCAMAAFTGKSSISDLGESDFDKVADYITSRYITTDAWRGFLWKVAFPNSGLLQYGFDKPDFEHKKWEYAETVLRAYRAGIPLIAGRNCALCGSPAVFIAARRQIPLLNFDGIENFSPEGRAGLPVCGACLLAAHALPLGCQIVDGKLLAIYSDDDAITLAFARSSLHELRKMLQITSLEGEISGKSFARTRLIEGFKHVQMESSRLQAIHNRLASITGYYFSNHNKIPRLEIVELPSDVVHFLIQLQQQRDETVKQGWDRAVARGWVESKNREEDEDNTNRKNQLYEDLFTLPDQAFTFLRRHILPVRSWALAQFFMGKVMHMDQKTIDLLYELGTRFAAYSNEKSGFLFDFMRESSYTKWRQRIVEASYDSTRKHGKPLITSDEFLRVFTKPRDADKWWSWKLPRDIVTLRILELKGEMGEALPETEVIFDETSDEDEA